jgi:uncharacterized membrane protein
VKARHRVLAGSVAGVGALAYGVLSVLRFARLDSPSWDNAIFEQVVQSYAHFDVPRADVKGPGFAILGDHFSPVIAVLAPVYRVFPHAQTLLIAQVVLIAVSAWVVTALAIRHLGARFGTVLGVAYTVSFGVQSAIVADFHEVAFAAPLLALAGSAYVEQRWRAVVGWSVPLLLVKEDMGLTVAVIGFVLWLAGERRRGLALGLAGIAAFAVVVGVLIPAFGDGGYAYTHNLGHDGSPLSTLFDALNTKVSTVLLTLAVSGFAALLSPWTLLVVPTFAWRFTGNVVYYWGTDWHYSLVLMPIVFVAAIDTVRRHGWAVWSVAITAVMAAVSLPTSPVAALFHRDLYQPSEQSSARQAAVDAVPAGLAVEGDIHTISHLVSDHRTYWLGSSGSADADAVVFDTTLAGSPADPVSYAEQKFGGHWRLVLSRASYVTAVRVGSSS